MLAQGSRLLGPCRLVGHFRSQHSQLSRACRGGRRVTPYGWEPFSRNGSKTPAAVARLAAIVRDLPEPQPPSLPRLDMLSS